MSISRSVQVPKAPAEYSRNSNANARYHLATVGHLSFAEPQRRRRRKKSRIVNSSRSVASKFADQRESFSDLPDEKGTQKTEQPEKAEYHDLSQIVIDDYIESRKFSRSISASAPVINFNEVEEKLVNARDSGTTLSNSQAFPEHRMKKTAQHPSCSSINLDFAEKGCRRVDGSYLSEIVHRSELDVLETSSYYEQDSKLELSVTDIVVTDADDETLPPYYQIVPEMFYRFAGISEYSDSTTLQSRGDFNKLLKCLAMDSLLDEFLVWFPKPKLVKPGRGYISLDMFCELFSCKFAQTILESRWQYETLCSAILTMKCLDKSRQNRVTFTQFSQLYRSLNGDDVETEDIRTVFEKYDTDGIGQLTIVNIFDFCADEEEDGELTKQL